MTDELDRANEALNRVVAKFLGANVSPKRQRAKPNRCRDCGKVTRHIRCHDCMGVSRCIVCRWER